MKPNFWYCSSFLWVLQTLVIKIFLRFWVFYPFLILAKNAKSWKFPNHIWSPQRTRYRSIQGYPKHNPSPAIQRNVCQSLSLAQFDKIVPWKKLRDWSARYVGLIHWRRIIIMTSYYYRHLISTHAQTGNNIDGVSSIDIPSNSPWHASYYRAI